MGARDAGICPVREDLYAQCFDELIRQLTLDGPERGLLLLRVRDEVRMTVDAYKVLYDSSVTFGVRKQLQAEHAWQSSRAASRNWKRKIKIWRTASSSLGTASRSLRSGRRSTRPWPTRSARTRSTS